MSTTALTIPLPPIDPATMEKVLLTGDLAELSDVQRINYYKAVCDSVGLNPLTRPFEYIKLNGKTTLYAKRECTEQLRQIHHVSISIASREVVEGCYVVTAHASLPEGRCDESIGAVPLGELKGEARANAIMKCETKAKRRVTLAICGLSLLDELEVATVPSAREVTGSRQEVLDRRLAETAASKAAREAAKQAVPEGPHYEEVEAEPMPSEDEIPTIDLAAQLKASIKIAEAKKDGLHEDIQRFGTKKTKKGKSPEYYELLQAIREQHERYAKIAAEATYYSILGQYGVTKSNEFPDTASGTEHMSQCYKELSLEASELEAALARARGDLRRGDEAL